MRDRRTDEHREILERKLGRPLLPSEVADHDNMDKTDNSPTNLRPMSRSAHSRMHATREQRTLGKLRKVLNTKQKIY